MFIDKLLIARLYSLLELRNTSVSNQLKEFIQLSNDSIGLVKMFWKDVSHSNPHLDIETLIQIACSIQESKSMWKLYLSTFQNEPSFVLEYSNYLIDCLGKTDQGAYWKLKSQHLKALSSIQDDPLFIQMINTKPELYKLRYVDKDGLVVLRNYDLENYSLTQITTHIQTFHDVLDQDLEHGLLDELQSQLFKWPILRSLIARGTSHYNVIHPVFNIILFFVFLCWIVLIALGFYFNIIPFQKSRNSFSGITTLIDLRLAMDYGFNALLLRMATNQKSDV